MMMPKFRGAIEGAASEAIRFWSRLAMTPRAPDDFEHAVEPCRPTVLQENGMVERHRIRRALQVRLDLTDERCRIDANPVKGAELLDRVQWRRHDGKAGSNILEELHRKHRLRVVVDKLRQ